MPTVHPRARGERTRNVLWAPPSSGSSPRARGTAGDGVGDPVRDRFIPARAGNGPAVGVQVPTILVHPRARGERVENNWPNWLVLGSSPRARGTGVQRRIPIRLLRFIPARAGNGPEMCSGLRRLAVHPRARGERRRI